MTPVRRRDNRGWFIKTFHNDAFAELGLQFSMAEEFITYSSSGVLRGLHFQTPPFDHDKLVSCIHGEAWDVVVDLRADSPTFGQHEVVLLSAESQNQLFIPAGFAHGFCVPGSHATLIYKVNKPYAPDHDRGIRWDTAGVQWPVVDPVISERDRELPALADFTTPFRLSLTR